MLRLALALACVLPALASWHRLAGGGEADPSVRYRWGCPPPSVAVPRPPPHGLATYCLKPLAGCCSHGGAAVPDPAHPNEYYFVLSHGYHYTGKPNWLDDTWVWSSRTKSWRMYGLRSMDWPHARYAIQLGQWALVPPLHVQL